MTTDQKDEPVIEEAAEDPVEPTPLLVREVVPPPPPAARALLERAGIDPIFLSRWEEEGRLFVIGDVTDDGTGPYPAAALIAAAGGRTVELRAMAVAPGEDEAGLRLLRDLIRRVCSEGNRRLLAPVPSRETGLTSLLQAAGFRPAHVERDAATPERGYLPSASRDLLWLELVLG